MVFCSKNKDNSWNQLCSNFQRNSLPFPWEIKRDPSQGEGLKAHVLKPGQLAPTHISWALSVLNLPEICPHYRAAPEKPLPFPEARGTDGDPTILPWGLCLWGEILPSSGFLCDDTGLMQQLPKGTCCALPSVLLQEHVLLFLLNPKFKAT